MSNTISRLYPEHVPLFISSFSCRFGPFSMCGSIIANMIVQGLAYPANNLAIYVPFNIPFNYPINRWWTANSNTAAGNTDIGIYNIAGTKIASTGAVAQAGTNVIQYISTPTILLPAGSYYLALSNSLSTSNFQASNGATAIQLRAFGVLQQATANPLPSSMTPATVANAFLPLFGFTRTTTGF